MGKRYINRFRSFENSLRSLEELPQRDLHDDFVISGAVQKFSLTFDISWKVMKDIVTKYFGLTDFATGSPRETLRAACATGLIQDDNWMKMLRDRNNLTHDYDGSLARQAVYQIKDVYIPLFEQFRDTAAQYIEKMEDEQ